MLDNQYHDQKMVFEVSILKKTVIKDQEIVRSKYLTGMFLEKLEKQDIPKIKVREYNKWLF